MAWCGCSRKGPQCRASSGGGAAGWSVSTSTLYIPWRRRSSKALRPFSRGVSEWVFCAKNWQLSELEFEAFLLPHLSMPKRGPKCKLGYHRVFHLILWVLYTGMQWKCLPVPTDPEGKPAIHYTTVYKAFAKWAD